VKPGRTLPLRLAPLPGEALDSWLDALAHRLKVPLTDLCWSLGLPGGPHNVLRKDGIPASRVVLLRDHEAQAISAAAGVPVPALHAMTMARYDRRAIMMTTPAAGSASAPCGAAAADHATAPAAWPTPAGAGSSAGA
jgi:TniQ